ncbi:hypothetical protein AB0I60_06230 [Actinosynnema sp. NPDC050436]|uniref:trypsin-like serine peptidase n=1 Tax=Actinosynnema sp. NPDC050436 TaxID=3155659 RepID=UPI0033FFCC3A
MTNTLWKQVTRVAAAGAVALVVAGGAATAASAAPGDPATAGAGVSTSREEARQITEYWTEDRLRAATEIPVPTRADSTTAREAAPVDRLAGISAAGSTPQGATASGGPDVGVTAVEQAQRWNRQGQSPAVTLGKLYSTGGSCTASIITAGNRNTVWTAGHCIHRGGGGAGNYYRNFLFVPDADNGREPHGRWAFKYANTTSGWANNADLDFDVAAIAFWPQAQRGNLADRFGAQGYRFGFGRDFPNVHTFGFPSDGYRRADFDGRNLWYCQGAARTAGPSDDRMVIGCDMGRGSGGGPFIDDLQPTRGWGFIVGNNSHRDVDVNGNYLNNNLYSAYHGDAAINVYNDVSRR